MEKSRTGETTRVSQSSKRDIKRWNGKSPVLLQAMKSVTTKAQNELSYSKDSYIQCTEYSETVGWWKGNLQGDSQKKELVFDCTTGEDADEDDENDDEDKGNPEQATTAPPMKAPNSPGIPTLAEKKRKFEEFSPALTDNVPESNKSLKISNNNPPVAAIAWVQGTEDHPALGPDELDIKLGDMT